MTTPVVSRGAIALRQCGANGTQIAARVGAAYPTVNNWLKGHRTPGPELRTILSKFYAIETHWWDEPAAASGGVSRNSGQGGLLDMVQGEIDAVARPGQPVPIPITLVPEAGPVDPRSEAEALAAHVRQFRWRVENDSLLTANEKAKTLELASRAVERLYRLTGEAANIPVSRILASPAWAKIKDAITTALAAHPEALRATVSAIEGLE